ncbi:DNA-processing protein DprA [Nesterenkonia alkaliphila]|uniref:DNA protecting protein DprA n=1 Tax=Nesterenkonia alkaliphila TaxID=1463631 RepID=A0A7K1UJ27_9MICC|nr:DNA-processing protein DprA [Nesterenkonia alkaliphila]MVT26483.1 DNA protecting protein DprA [Nesterenkonia alkaliphila]
MEPSTTALRAGARGVDDETIIKILVATRKYHPLTQPERVQLLQQEGADYLLEALFGTTLIDPELELEIERACVDLQRWQAQGYGVLSVLDHAYPRYLRGAWEAPALLYYQGEVVPEDTAVSVVGSRRVSPDVRDQAARTAEELVSRGLTVASGLAAGIDGAAHDAALEAQGRTVAVMGTGLDHTYPASHLQLREQIVETGLVLSQFEPDFSGAKFAFPMRNHVMSAYGLATIVISAQEKSGTRHQARAAIGHSRGLIISDQVARETSWGHEYAERGLARVVYSAEEAAAVAHELVTAHLRGTQLFG